ncbi:MAG: phosphatase PAP2 family protein [Candidatus Aminicenantes bacterium]|nr:phosphatase PAP2 family protein [Candidatus Aminicenantes bacterium]
MFLTEINIFLQSLSSAWLTAVFKFFSFVGEREFMIPFMIAITFGIHFRYGFIIFHISFWSSVITNSLKDVFALPRPHNVDAAVQLLGENTPNPTPFKGMGAKHFFGCLPGEIVEYFRTQGVWLGGGRSFGFPSGHASSAISLWGAIFLFNRLPWLRIIAVIFILFIPLSRLYLGLHFLADVLGGLLIGLAVLLFFYRFIFLDKKLQAWLFEKIRTFKTMLPTIFFLIYCFIFPFLLLLIPGIHQAAAPTLLGLNCSFFMVRLRGLPQEGGTLRQRLSRIAIAALFYFGINLALKWPANLEIPLPPGIIKFTRETLTICLSIWGAYETNIKLGLFKISKNDA